MELILLCKMLLVGGGGSSSKLQTKSVNITQNGESRVTPDAGYDGLRKVNITTNVQPVLQNKTVIPSTSQQTINADNNYDGLNTVTVNAVDNTIDQNITAGNIKLRNNYFRCHWYL